MITPYQIEAVFKLNPSVVTLHGDVAYDADGKEVQYDLVAVQAEAQASAAAINALVSRLQSYGLLP